MIVEGLQLKNFQCYAGEIEENTFRFTRGLNLIIGENGSGKSKIWDAFYWVLYDEIFQSDQREFVRTSVYKEQLIADKAKYECDIGESVDAKVILTARTSTGKVYKVTRVYKATKMEDGSFVGSDRSNLIIEEKKSTRWETLTPDRHESIIDTIIPSHLRKYMWFQGEHINQLMDLRDKSALSNVIELLSDIKTYNSLIEIAKNGSRDATRALQSARRSSSQDSSKASDLERSLNVNNDLLARRVTQLDKSKQERQTAEGLRDDLLIQVDTARERRGLAGELKQVEGEISSLSRDFDLKIEAISKNLITRQWVLMHCESSLKKFEERYSEFDRRCHDYKKSFDNDVSPLPVDIPRPVDIRQMLSAEVCLVCGRDAKQGTSEHHHIAELLNRIDKAKEEPFLNDTQPYLSGLYRTTLEHATKRKEILSDISSEYEAISGLRAKIDRKNQDKKSLLNQLPGGVDEQDLSSGESILNQFNMHDRRAQDADREIRECEEAIKNLRALIAKEGEELAGIAGAGIPLEKIVAAEVWEKLLGVAEDARRRVFQGIVDDLELRANEIFSDMTARTNSITGRLRLEVTAANTCIPKIVDSAGNTLAGSNDSNIILIKLALIMAVLTAKQKWSENYALIADAPTSKMAENYSDGFYAALSANFEQSIVVTYDFLDDEDRHRLKDLHIGEVYLIKSSHGSEERESRHDLKVTRERVAL